jgi:hypothetical protein
MTDEELTRLLDLDRTPLPADGGPAYNRLIFSRSPYLLQHAGNPTDWHQWGEEAFAEAERRNVPLLVSIGYATCHWCHVMAHESFADSDVASALNRACVPVKVDREERPDLDDLYMAAAMAMNGSGGWPLNVFIDHRRRPFYAFTYLPPESRNGMPGLVELVEAVTRAWQERPEAVERNATALMEGMTPPPSAAGPPLPEPEQAIATLERLYDPLHGGIGSAPKFPMAPALRFLLTAGGGAAAMALQTLRAMAAGGIHDQLAGGFHRYAVDRGWQVPHFEKMLYDQALLTAVYTDGYRVNGDAGLLETARRTARFVLAELTDADGGFCAGLDADSEGEEGRFYLWTPEEAEEVLGRTAGIWKRYWGLDRRPQLEGGNVLHLAVDPGPFARSEGLTPAELEEERQRAAALLLARRRQRPRPLRDPKVLAAWNGLMIGALARLAAAGGGDEWLRHARRATESVLQRLLTTEGRLLRSWLRGPADVPAFLEDYACLGWGMAELATAAEDRDLLARAAWLGDEMLRLFDRADGSLAFCGSDAEPLPLDLPGGEDGALPSPRGMAALFLARLSRQPGGDRFIAPCRRLLATPLPSRSPMGCVTAIMAAQELGDQGTVVSSQ